MPFDIAGARKAGHTDTEITDFLSAQSKFDVAGARKSGYSDDEILSHLAEASSAPPAAQPAAPATPEGYTSSAGGYGTEALKMAGNIGGGFVESAGQGMTSVGRILGLESPEDSAARREDITRGLQERIGYDPKSTSAATGGFLGDVALTAGVPAGMAKTILKTPVVNALAPRVMNYLSPAFESAGFGRGLGVGQRVLGGSATGAATGAVVDDDPTTGAITGAVLGGTLPMAIPLAKGALAAAKPVARGIYGSVEPLFEKGGQAVKNRIISQAFGGDEVQMQQALDMLDKGATLKDIAIQFNNPTLAGLANAAERLPFADISGAYAEKAGARNVAAINQLSGAEAFANKAAAAARATQVSETAKAFPQQDMEALGIPVREQAKIGYDAARKTTKAAYDETEALAANLPAMEAPGIFQEAKRIIGEDGFGKNVPELADVLFGMEKRAKAAKAASPNAYQFPFGGQPIEESIPPLTFNELTSIIKAVNADIRQVASNPELRPKLRNLIKLRGSVETFIANAPETVIPKTIKDSLADANALYKSAFARKYKVGKTQSNLLLDRNGAPVIADERVIANFFKPNNPSAARRFVDMLGGNPVAYDAMEKGILETFRSKVVKNGVIDQNAYKGFIENYRAPLKVLEDAGVDVSAITNKEASLGVFGKAADSAESLAVEAKALQTKYNADPNKVVSTIVNDFPEAQAIVASIRKEIASGKVFDELVSQGGVGAGLLKQEPISVLPTGNDVFTKLLTWTARRLSGGALDKQTRDIAIGLMNETATKDLIKRSIQASPSGYAKTGERVKKAFAPRPPPRMNNLAPRP
jgi:hypothetical protein